MTTLQDDEIYKLLQESFLVQDFDAVNSRDVRLSNMWILYCGITRGKCSSVRRYLHISHPPMIFEHGAKNVLYLFQCFQEAHDDQLCDIYVYKRFGLASESPHKLNIIIIGYNCRTHMGEYVTMQMYKIK